MKMERSIFFRDLALSQAQRMSHDWEPKQRDCAGLVRYLFRKAVFTSTQRWKNSQGEEVPYVGASELVNYNFRFLGRDPDELELQTGDLIVYYRHDRRFEDAWHLMVYLAPPPFKGDSLVIYHNGERSEKGEVRKVSWHELQSEHAREWRVHANNPVFKGIYRWNEF